jgi:succinate dehydrogenase / fumarate reductase flavoprotein subunit
VKAPGKVKPDAPECAQSIAEVKATTEKYLKTNGKRTVTEFIRELGTLMWENVGMARSKESLTKTLAKIPAIRAEFNENVKVSGSGAELNQQLENAGRTADFLEFAELLTRDALHREESCGGHFRVEHQYPDGEAKRDDANFCYVGAWEFKGVGKEPELHKEPLKFENVHLAVRSYK